MFPTLDDSFNDDEGDGSGGSIGGFGGCGGGEDAMAARESMAKASAAMNRLAQAHTAMKASRDTAPRGAAAVAPASKIQPPSERSSPVRPPKSAGAAEPPPPMVEGDPVAMGQRLEEVTCDS